MADRVKKRINKKLYRKDSAGHWRSLVTGRRVSDQTRKRELEKLKDRYKRAVAEAQATGVLWDLDGAHESKSGSYASRTIKLDLPPYIPDTFEIIDPKERAKAILSAIPAFDRLAELGDSIFGDGVGEYKAQSFYFMIGVNTMDVADNSLIDTSPVGFPHHASLAKALFEAKDRLQAMAEGKTVGGTHLQFSNRIDTRDRMVAINAPAWVSLSVNTRIGSVRKGKANGKIKGKQLRRGRGHRNHKRGSKKRR